MRSERQGVARGASVTHRKHRSVDPHSVGIGRESVEEVFVIRFALPAVRNVGIVRHEHENSIVLIDNRAQVWIAGRPPADGWGIAPEHAPDSIYLGCDALAACELAMQTIHAGAEG